MGTATTCLLAVVIAAASPGAAVADPAVPKDAPAEIDASPPARARHTIFVEGLGRGGLWGLGYSFELHRRWAVGGVASLSILDGQHIWSASPYITAYIAGGARHRWFVDAGPQIVHTSTPSPVPEWMGTSSTGIGAQVASGYERRGPVVLRAFAMAAVGENGFAPWLGFDVGWKF